MNLSGIPGDTAGGTLLRLHSGGSSRGVDLLSSMGYRLTAIGCSDRDACDQVATPAPAEGKGWLRRWVPVCPAAPHEGPSRGGALSRLRQAARRSLATRTARALDGTIFVDPAVLAYMVQATGPITEAQTGITLSADEVVAFMTNGAYESLPGPARKRLLGEAAATILGRFLQGTDPVAALRALASAAGDGHLVVHAANPEVQGAFAAAGMDGSIGPDRGDYLGVFLTNAAGNKVDYYLDPRLSYHVILGADGMASAEASVGLANGAPSGQQPSEVLGPYGSNGLEPGDTQWWVETFCAPGCLLQETAEDGGPGSVQPLHERGLPMFRSFVRANAGETSTLGYRFHIPNAWRGDEAGGTYELTLQAQPTVRPVRAEIAIRAPEGMGVVATSEPMRVRGGLAQWRGTVEGKVTLWVKFERPILGRMWARLWSLLTKPVLRLG